MLKGRRCPFCGHKLELNLDLDTLISYGCLNCAWTGKKYQDKLGRVIKKWERGLKKKGYVWGKYGWT